MDSKPVTTMELESLRAELASLEAEEEAVQRAIVEASDTIANLESKYMASRLSKPDAVYARILGETEAAERAEKQAIQEHEDKMQQLQIRLEKALAEVEAEHKKAIAAKEVEFSKKNEHLKQEKESLIKELTKLEDTLANLKKEIRESADLSGGKDMGEVAKLLAAKEVEDDVALCVAYIVSEVASQPNKVGK